MGPTRRAVAPFVLASALVACPQPGEGIPPIRVEPGAASRIRLIPSKRDFGKTTPPKPSTVRVATTKDLLRGPNAVGKAGDILLENEDVVFVIDRMGGGTGFAESGGNIVDAADARDRVDELGQVFSFFGTFPRQAVYESLESGVDADGTAWVMARGHELYEGALRVETSYRLAPGSRSLRLETTLTNTGSRPLGQLRLGDAVQWGASQKFAPGKEAGFKGPSQGPFLGGAGRRVSYALLPDAGDFEALSGSGWSDTMQTPPTTLEPGQRVQYARDFFVGTRGDRSSIWSEVAQRRGAGMGQLEVALRDEGGAPLVTGLEGGVRLRITATQGGEAYDVRSPGGQESPVVDLPEGAYTVQFETGAGRRAAGPAAPITVTRGGRTSATLVVTGAGKIRAQCTEKGQPVPCKVTVEALDGSPKPDFGPRHVAGPAGHQITTGRDGVAAAPLAPGRYRISASRGPEYAVVQREVHVAAGGETDVPCELVRVLDTREYVATDFHQHTMMGADAPVGLRDRVVANAAEGVEVAVASEHNTVVDLQPVVRELGLEAFLVEVPGNEVTSDASRHPWGHANVFPLEPDATKARGGASVVRDRTPKAIFDELRADGRPRVFQINHPRTGITGYFDQMKFDAAKGEGTEPGYDPVFDALEVWNGRNVESRRRVIEDFRALVRTGHPVTATADTDTHGIVDQEAGYPRTYVRVRDDEHLDAWTPERTADLVAGVRTRRDVVLTNGPFLRVDAHGAGIGGLAKAKNGRIRVDVTVSSAPWVEVNRVGITWVRSGVIKEVPVQPEAQRAGALEGKVSFTFDVREDDAFFVTAEGKKPLRPVLDGDEREIEPYAMTGAIWVDADGNGISLGRRAPIATP